MQKFIKKFIKKFIPQRFFLPLKNFILKIRFLKLIIILFFQKKKKIALIFEEPEYGNIGDQAIMMATVNFIRKCSQYIIFGVPLQMTNLFIKKLTFIPKHFLIINLGGGFIGSLWKDGNLAILETIKNYPQNRILIFPQTVYYSDDEKGKQELQLARKIYQAHPDLHVFIRDESYNYMKGNVCGGLFNDVRQVPDIVLTLNYSNHSYRRNGVLFCIRNDKESIVDLNFIQKKKNELLNNQIIVKDTDTCVPYSVKKRMRKKEIRKKLFEFQTSKLVITDRLHGMIFACITGTPCIAVNNISKKVEGVWNLWLRQFDYIRFLPNIELLTDELINEMLDKGGQKYDNACFDPYWEEIKNVINLDKVQYICKVEERKSLYR